MEIRNFEVQELETFFRQELKPWFLKGVRMPKDKSTFFKSKNNWFIIKENLLSGYLPQYFRKVRKTHRPIRYGFIGMKMPLKDSPNYITVKMR